MKKIKYPRTFHVPFSPGATSDDKRAQNMDRFYGAKVVVTEKMDGENTTLYRDTLHARSLDYAHHPSRSHIKALHGQIASSIPESFRICGENLFAVHSIQYQHLKAYFQVFSIWDLDRCLSWEETVEWTSLLGLETVPVLYQGHFDDELLKKLRNPVSFLAPGREDPFEGYVLRLADGFLLKDFSISVAKWVRPGHVQSEQHWSKAPIRINHTVEGQKPHHNDSSKGGT